jgi:hypothetical protein
MSVNLIHAINGDKVKRFGQLWPTIDFEHRASGELNADAIQQRYTDTVIGDFLIGGKRFQITLKEIERVIETLQTAQQVFRQKYRMGAYGRR